jgi:hypothetical protein
MDDFVESIRETILKNKKPSYQTTNKKEVRVRCPYCGDSRRDLSSAHLYIEMRAPFRFHCFKCETSGVLNNQTLRDLEIFDTSMNTSIIGANKAYRENQGIQKVQIGKRKKLTNIPDESDITLRNLKYLNDRLLTDFDMYYVSSKFRTILNPIKFFADNNIFVPNGHYDFTNAIGFISTDNSHIVFRDTSGKQPRTYYNMNISRDDVEDIASKIFNISSSIDAMSEKVNLVITEGIFDIIGVYSHFYKDTPIETNTIFTAACGKGFNAVILNYIRSGFLDLNITIYSDGDVDLNFYKNLKSTSEYLKNSKITIYYNSLYNKTTGFGKDYGVPKDQIQLRKIIV